jgi:spore coat polysaccharide biosynthesis protein SpsF
MKLGAIIPIRLASERLPGKALIEICGRPVLWHLLDRVCASRFLKKKDVVVCTTEDESDGPLADAVQTYGCSVFRGNRDDLIKRFHDAIARHGFDAVVQIDGDDPLSDTEYMDLTMEKLLADSTIDIVTCEGLPLGIATKSFTRSAMEKVYRHYKTEKNDTGFIYFFTRTGLCKQVSVRPKIPGHVLDEARLTLDYGEDLEVFTRIFEALYVPGQVFGLEAVVRFLREHPEVMKLNSGLDEEYWRRTREKAQLFYSDARGEVQKI